MLAWKGEGLTESHRVPGSYCKVMAAGVARVGFLQGCDPGELAHAPADSPTPVSTEAHRVMWP